jgi:colicin import membrane protein
MARSQSSAARRTKPDDLYKYGYRHLPNGDMIPLTEDDLLHPQEGDFVVTNKAHALDLAYLLTTFEERAAQRPGVCVLPDHVVDFQHGGVENLGPDVTVVDGVMEWDNTRGVFPVADMKARLRFVIELTSANTRRTDLRRKPPLYYRAGVPLLISCDAAYGGAKKPLGLLAYGAGPKGYDSLPLDANGRFWLEAVGAAIGIENGRVACYEADGTRIGDRMDEAIGHKREKARADELQRRVEELEAQLKKAKRRKN